MSHGSCQFVKVGNIFTKKKTLVVDQIIMKHSNVINRDSYSITIALQSNQQKYYNWCLERNSDLCHTNHRHGVPSSSLGVSRGIIEVGNARIFGLFNYTSYPVSLWALLILQPFCHFTYVTAHSPTHSVTLPTSQLILQPFRCFTNATSSFSNPSFASLTSQDFHLRHLASRPCNKLCLHLI